MNRRSAIFCLGCLLIFATAFDLCGAELSERYLKEPVFDTRVRVIEAGKQHPISLLLIHGVGPDGAEIWRELLPTLARDYHVIACDLPGFGRSDKPNVLYSPEQFSAFFSWLIEQTVPGQYILAGHSLGGALTLYHTATAARRPQKLILVDAAGVLHRAALTKFLLHLKITEDKPYAPSGPLDWLGQVAGTMVEKLQGLPVDLELVLQSETLRARFLGGDPNKIAGLALIETDFTPLIDRVDVPTYLIWGENDEVAPLRTGILLAARLPRAELKLIPGGGHVPMRRQPGTFRQAFWQALQSLPTEPPPQTPQTGDRTGRCSDQDEALFSGAYREIIIERCRDVELTDIRAGKVSVVDSTVSFERGHIDADGIGLDAVRSKVVATALDITADVPIRTDQSSFDLAGVRLKSGGAELVVGKGNPSRLLFSVSRGITPNRNEALHDVINVNAQQGY